jgi:hypothetical protein
VPDEPYRAPLPIEPDPYMVAWADLRKRRRVERVTLVVGGCVWALVVILKVFGLDFLEVRPGQTGLLLGHLLLVSFAVAAGWVGIAHSEFRCPRCTMRSADSYRTRSPVERS